MIRRIKKLKDEPSLVIMIALIIGLAIVPFIVNDKQTQYTKIKSDICKDSVLVGYHIDLNNPHKEISFSQFSCGGIDDLYIRR